MDRETDYYPASCSTLFCIQGIVVAEWKSSGQTVMLYRHVSEKLLGRSRWENALLVNKFLDTTNVKILDHPCLLP